MERTVDQTIYEDDAESRISTLNTIRNNEDEEKSIGEGSSRWNKEIYPPSSTNTNENEAHDSEKQTQTHLPLGTQYYTTTNPPTQDLPPQGSPPTGSQLQLPPHRTLERLAQKDVKPMDQISMTLGGPIIIFFDLIVPCIIYYVWLHAARRTWVTTCQENNTPLDQCADKPSYNSWILGISVVSFGFGEIYILLVRIIRLVGHRDECAPLLSRHWAELDATSWVYLTSLIIPLIAFVVSTNMPKVVPWLYLYAPGFLMGFLLCLSLVTLIPFRIPYGINSDPRGSRLKPLVYYAAEDFIAVDGWQGREFRQRFKDRYEASKMFRRFFLWLQVWWCLGASIYVGVLGAIIWNLEFEYAFGVSFGVLFSYITIWASTTFVWVKWEMHREKRAFEEGDPGF
jgi:hypothetical protein